MTAKNLISLASEPSTITPAGVKWGPASDVFAAPPPAALDPSKPTEGPARKRARGKRHPGVVLLAPNPARRIWWRARYVDPDSGRTVKETIDRALTSAALREDWCARKSRALALRRLALAGGAARATGATLASAVDAYFTDHPQHAPHTLAIYRSAAARFLAWAEASGIRSADVLDGPALVRFRAAMIRLPLRRAVKGGRLGEKADTNERRAPISINQDLRSMGTVLTYLRRLGLMPRLTAEGVSDGLQKLKLAVDRIDFRQTYELRALLDAAVAHDAARFSFTRAAKRAGAQARRRTPGLPPKHRPMVPFIVAAMLTGARLGELLSLTWDRVNLDTGEIYIGASNTKTRRARTIDLSVCPALADLLRRLRPAKGAASGLVFGFTRGALLEGIERLKGYGAPSGIGAQALRRTVGTFLTNAPGIFGAASAYRSAKQLGHSVTIAERHYLGVVKIDPSARTLEAAMGIADHPALGAVDGA